MAMTKSARARFSASGICRARMRSSIASVMPGRASTRARCTSAGAVTTRTPSRPRSPPVSKSSGMSRRTTSARGVRGERRRRGRRRRADGRGPRCGRGAPGRRRRRRAGGRGRRRRRRPRPGTRSASAAGPGTAGGVEPVHRGVGVPDRHAGLGEEGGGGRLAHADRAGEAEPVGPPSRQAPRRGSASSTSGRTPNQRSKPGTRLVQQHAEAVDGRRGRSRRASATKGVGSAP